MDAMAKAATAKPKKQARKTPARKPRRLTLAEKIRRANIRWTGDDLEEIIALVEGTRTPSRF